MAKKRRKKKRVSLLSKLVKRYGWKTIIGTVFATTGEYLTSFHPDYYVQGSWLIVVGVMLGGVGLIHKFDKIRQDLLWNSSHPTRTRKPTRKKGANSATVAEDKAPG